MSESVTNAGNRIWEMRVAIFWFTLFSVNALCSAITISLLNATWRELDHQGKFLIVVGVIWNWTTTTMAFVSKESSRIKKTGEILPDENYSQTTASQTLTVSETKTEAK